MKEAGETSEVRKILLAFHFQLSVSALMLQSLLQQHVQSTGAKRSERATTASNCAHT